MILDNMRFGDYIWSHNPENVNVSTVRNIKELALPFVGDAFQDYGRKKRIAKGTGEFFGKNCVMQFEKLFKVYDEGKKNALYIPGVAQFYALFKNLEITCDTIPDLIAYKFEFWEVANALDENNNEVKKYHIVKEGESLYSIAEKYGISLINILDLNPSIKNLNSLETGRKVILR